MSQTRYRGPRVDNEVIVQYLLKGDSAAGIWHGAPMFFLLSANAVSGLSIRS
jgi:hypothetical protein